MHSFQNNLATAPQQAVLTDPGKHEKTRSRANIAHQGSYESACEAFTALSSRMPSRAWWLTSADPFWKDAVQHRTDVQFTPIPQKCACAPWDQHAYRRGDGCPTTLTALAQMSTSGTGRAVLRSLSRSPSARIRTVAVPSQQT